MSFHISRRSLIGAASVGATFAAGGIRAIAAAVPEAPLFGPDEGIARLCFNENPYGPSPAAIRAMSEAASKGCYYTGAANDRLIDMIAERFGVSREQVVLGSGSTELLSGAALAWGTRGTILLPELTYDSTAVYAENKGAKLIRVPMRADMGIDLHALAEKVGPSVSMVHICNPNNPTGMLLDPAELRDFIRRVGPTATVLVDEAYNELTDRPEANSVADMVRDGHNAIVFRTFSKIYGLAGLRIGYAIASPEHAEILRSYSTSLGGSVPALAAAIASYNDAAFTRFSKNRVVEGRDMIVEAARRAGLPVLPSQTNFVFVKVPDADAMRAAMEQRGIIIRGAYGPWKQWSRVSAGKIEDVRRYAAALPEALKAVRPG